MQQHLTGGGAGTSLRQNVKDLVGHDIYVGEYEKIKKSDRGNSVGRDSYVERNCLMIKDSNFVVGHLDEKRNGGKSGTRLAYKYALKQKKSITTV